MKLSDALIETIKMRGESILSSTNLVPLLDDLGAFKDTKSYRNVIRTFQSEGYMSDSITLSEKDVEKFIYSVVYNTGFQESIVTEVFVAIRESIGRPIVCYNKQDNLYPKEKRTLHVQHRLSPLTEHSTEQDIVDYLNSILEVDYESFKENGLCLQNLGKIRYCKEVKKSDWLLPGQIKYAFGKIFDLSYEIIGQEFPSKGCIMLYVYDIDNNLRAANFLGNVEIGNDLSIVNEKKEFGLFLPLNVIGKAVLRIENKLYYCCGNAMESESNVAKYNGTIEFRTPDINIYDLQVLGVPDKEEKEISFFIRYDLSQEGILQRNDHLNVYATLFDKIGKMRQRCSIIKNQLIYSMQKNNYVAAAFSQNDRGSNILRMPYNEIGKIIISDELFPYPII